ncbi:MAG: S46 family peptidase [Bacteroidetes bacterium]|nr:S46 family peptidase [Bacteroidota bacterium]MCY4204407.1 S46 family peptidase [Bacteroidota bacterium]
MKNCSILWGLIVFTLFPSVQARQITTAASTSDSLLMSHIWDFQANAGTAEGVGLPDTDWVENALLGTLQLPGCAAALVSANGLAVTSAACLRSLDTWIRPGDTLFVADELSQEHRLEGLKVRQLSGIKKIENPGDTFPNVEPDMQSQIHKGRGHGSYWKYSWRVYDDVRLVFIPPIELENFGDEDSVYPRYAMDFALFRVYDKNDQLLDTESYFAWNDRPPRYRERLYATVFSKDESFTRVTILDRFDYNGTVSPSFTTMYGILDLHHSHGAMSSWALPAELKSLIAGSDLSTALNFSVAGECAEMGVAIIDIDMEILGISFDNAHTQEGLRCVGMSTAGILSLLRSPLNAKNIVEELAEQSRWQNR